MSNAPLLNEPLAHTFFAAECFNRAWTLIEKPDRSADEDEAMRALSHASFWHWTQRDDCTVRNLAIAYWQLSRVYALLGRGDDATRYAELCLDHSKDEMPFYLGYAHEALARAAMVAGNHQRMAQHLAKARQFAAQTTDTEERNMLDADLATIA